MTKSQSLLPSLVAFSTVLAPVADAQQNTRRPAADPNAADSPLVSNAESDSYAIAEQLYAHAQTRGVDAASRTAIMNRAAELFGDFTKKFPNNENRDKAQYLQAICQAESGNHQASNANLASLANGRHGEYAAAAAYKLGTQAVSRNLWETAIGYFRIAIRETQRPALRSDATYRLGRSLQQMGNRQEAENAFRQVQVMQDVQPSVAQAAILSLAQMKTEDGADAEAYPLYLSLLECPNLDARVRGTATLQAARLAARLGKADESQKLYQQLSTMAGMEKYAGEAQMETILNLYRNKDFEGIVRQVSGGYAQIDDPAMAARRALIVGQANMELKRYDSAAQWFALAEQAQPQTPMAADAGYRRIVCAQQLRSSGFLSLAEKYLGTYAQPGSPTAELPSNELVRLMYADRLMQAGLARAGQEGQSATEAELKAQQENIAQAARQFDALNIDRLPEAVQADALYKKAWCGAQVDGDRPSDDLMKTLESFISRFGQDARLPEALVLRATCRTKRNELGPALADYDRVINEFGDSAAFPVACQRAAQACAGKDNAKMVAYYEKLIACGAPRVKPTAIAEAHYSIARSLYEAEPARAIPHFEEAAKMDAEHYSKLVDLGLVQCHYKLKDAEKLHAALRKLEENNPASYQGLPPAILRWCGWMCSQSRKFVDANKYLSDALQREPQETYTAADGTQKTRAKVEPLVWKTLARVRLELKQYEFGLEPAQHYVSMESQPYRKADGMRDEAQLLIGLGRTAEARKVCEEAIALGIDGPLKSSVFITLGDACYVEKQYSEAAKYYGRTANVVNDKELKPQALYKIAKALRKAGKEGEASQYEESLRKEFPGWNPSSNDVALTEERPL